MRVKIEFAKSISIIMLTLAASALSTSVIYDSKILAFIGLGALFWAAVFYVQKPDYSTSAILEASVSASAGLLSQIVQSLDYEGVPVYLPPNYFESPEETRIFIPKQKDGVLPTPRQIQNNKNKIFLSSPPGMLLTPPGADLLRLFEKILGKSFTKVDIEYLQQRMPRLLVEDVEIATSLEIRPEATKPVDRADDSEPQVKARLTLIHVEIAPTAFQDTCKRSASNPTEIALECPLTSAIACAIVKATGKPTIIQNQETGDNDATVKILYNLIEKAPFE